MAQVIVELSGDERKVLQAYQKAKEADAALRDSAAQTGVTGAKAANEFAGAWIKSGKEASKGMDALLSQIGKTGPEGRKAAAEVEKYLQDVGKGGRQSLDALIAKLAEIDPEAAKAANQMRELLSQNQVRLEFDQALAGIERLGGNMGVAVREMKAELATVDGTAPLEAYLAKLESLGPAGADAAAKVRIELAAADKQSEFKSTLASMKALGGESAIVASKIEAELARGVAASAGDMDKLVAKLGELDPAAVDAANKIKIQLAEADKQSEFRSTLASMKALGGEAELTAKRIEEEIAKAAAASRGDLQTLVAKLGELDPAAADAAEKVKTELAEAAQYSEGKFEETLKKLRSMGPVGQTVARELKTHLVNAGQLAEDSIDNVIAKLYDIDPAAADAATSIKKIATDGEGAFATFGKSAVTQIASIASAYIGVQEAIQFVIAANQKVIETNKKVFDGLKQNESGDRGLLQVAKSPEDFQQMRTKADELAVETGISREEARRLVAAARREGFEDSMDSIAKNQQVLDVNVQTEVASKVPAIFKSEGISAEQAINAALVAAKQSSVSTEELASAIPIASEGGALAGASAAETMAVTAGISDQFNTPQVSADRVKALAMKIALDKGDTGTTNEEFKKLEQAENKRLEQARNNFRTLKERSLDVKVDIKQTQAKPKTDATERTLADLQTKLERAERAVREFDMSTLTKKEIKRDPARDSIAGKGLIEGVRMLAAMPADQRKSILKDDAESNTAFALVLKKIDEIERNRTAIQEQIDVTGTDQSAIAQARAMAEADPMSKARVDVAKSENALAVSREENRAVKEGQRQTGKNRALQGAENSGASQFRIGLAETAADTLEGFGVQNTADIIPMLAGNSIANLERDLSLAQNSGDDQAAKALLAANQLRQRRVNDKDAILSQQETSQFLSTKDRFVGPKEVTLEQQEELTRAIIEEANNARGIERSLATGFLRPLAAMGSSSAEMGLGYGAEEGSDAASRIRSRMLEVERTVPLQPVEQPNTDGNLSRAQQPATIAEPGTQDTSKELLAAQQEANRIAALNQQTAEQQTKLLESLNERMGATASNTVPRPQQPNAGEIARQARQK